MAQRIIIAVILLMLVQNLATVKARDVQQSDSSLKEQVQEQQKEIKYLKSKVGSLEGVSSHATFLTWMLMVITAIFIAVIYFLYNSFDKKIDNLGHDLLLPFEPRFTEAGRERDNLLKKLESLKLEHEALKIEYTKFRSRFRTVNRDTRPALKKAEQAAEDKKPKKNIKDEKIYISINYKTKEREIYRTTEKTPFIELHEEAQGDISSVGLDNITRISSTAAKEKYYPLFRIDGELGKILLKKPAKIKWHGEIAGLYEYGEIVLI